MKYVDYMKICPRKRFLGTSMAINFFYYVSFYKNFCKNKLEKIFESFTIFLFC